MKLSIIIPVYNEEKTISHVLEEVVKLELPEGVSKEIIAVDDGSKDNTRNKINKFKKHIKCIYHENNYGKGKAVITGIKNASGDYIVIQDADLEYNPKYINKLLKSVLDKNAAVVYGTRLKRWPNLKIEERNIRFLLHYFGNRFLSLLTSLLYGQWITDMETGYKLFPKKALLGVKLKARGFEFEPEITSVLLKAGYKIHEIPISVNPRGFDQGKKLNTFKDGYKALFYLLKYKFFDK